MDGPSHKLYSAVETGSEGEFDHFLEKPSPDVRQKSRVRQLVLLLPWALTVIFATLSIVLLIERNTAKEEVVVWGTYEGGFETDHSPEVEIPLELVTFRRSPHFDINGTGFLDPVDPKAPWPENMVLFGTPSEQIDDNWERLISDRYFSVTEEEATRAWGDKRHEYVDEEEGGYTAGLDVFHTLHCVNALRKALHQDYYGTHHSPFHVEHCLDILRQTVQCYGSTTLIPTRFREGKEHNYIDSDQTHVCRSFSALRALSTARQEEGELYRPRDMGLVDARKHAIAMAWAARMEELEREETEESKESKESHESQGHGHDH
ncbi:Cyclochlorotine biosynthesis protein O [Apiospora marii]|uniref:Cyclochlorotine biosynthesis protein O n=1 Tax=Apiospora marii TaxID=335849 RepID=A0ABR1RLA4_9PEZI